MKKPITEREIWLSVLYAILLIPLALGFNIAFGWLIDHVVLQLINWFNSLTLFWKIFLFFFEAVVLLYSIISVFKIIGSFITYLIFGKLPDNLFTIIFSGVVYLTNVGFSLVALWKATPRFSFWVVLEFILLVIIIFSVNTLLMPWYLKAKIEEGERRQHY